MKKVHELRLRYALARGLLMICLALTASACGPEALETNTSTDGSSMKPDTSVGQVQEALLPGTTSPAPTLVFNSSPSSGAQDLSTDSGYWADQQIAASSTHLVVTQRASIGFFTRGGTQLTHTNGNSFFSGLTPPGSTGVFDLRVQWDRWRSRFVMVGLANSNPVGNSRVLIAVSTSSNPNDPWCRYTTGAGFGGVANQGADYPMLGIGRSALMITYTVNGSNSIRIFPAQQMADCVAFGSLTGTWGFTGLTVGDGSSPGLIAPATMHTSPLDDRLYGAVRYGTNGVTVYRITNPLSSSRVLSQIDVAIPGEDFLSAFGQGNNLGAPQSGTTFRFGMYLFDGHTSQPVLRSVYRSGTLGLVTPDGHDWGSGLVSSIRFITLNPDTGAISRNRKWGASTSHYGWPGVDVNNAGDWAVSFTRTSATSFPEARYSAWSSSDTDFRPSTSIRAPGIAWTDPGVCGQYCARGSIGNGAETSSASLDGNGTTIWFSTMLPSTTTFQNFTQWVSRVYGN